MDLARIVAAWPGEPAVVALARQGGRARVVDAVGPLGERRAWASVSKLVVGLAAGTDVDAGRVRYEDPLGPPGATLAHLLSHSAGLGLEEGDRRHAVGTRRVYSNVGFDLVASALAGTRTPAAWLASRVFEPLELSASALEGRAAAGVVGSTDDLARLGGAWLEGALLDAATHRRIATPFLADLAGVVPGFGRFTPCPWGLGPELHGAKAHWMGDWPAGALGHFGRSGALVLLDVGSGVGVVATSSVPFGPWAVAQWPAGLSAIRAALVED